MILTGDNYLDIVLHVVMFGCFIFLMFLLTFLIYCEIKPARRKRIDAGLFVYYINF